MSLLGCPVCPICIVIFLPYRYIQAAEISLGVVNNLEICPIWKGKVWYLSIHNRPFVQRKFAIDALSSAFQSSVKTRRNTAPDYSVYWME
jgi:hypothetical protein